MPYAVYAAAATYVCGFAPDDPTSISLAGTSTGVALEAYQIRVIGVSSVQVCYCARFVPLTEQ
jgi:hypothetical protein